VTRFVDPVEKKEERERERERESCMLKGETCERNWRTVDVVLLI